MSPDQIMAVMRAAYMDGWGNAIDSILESLTEDKVTEGLRVALAKDPALREEMKGPLHEDIVLAYRGILGVLRMIVAREAPSEGVA